MNFDELYDQIKQGEISKEDARKRLLLDYLQTTSRYVLDTNRQMRNRLPEVLYAEYKTFEQLTELSDAMLLKNGYVIISRFPHPEMLKAHYSHKVAGVFAQRIVLLGDMPRCEGKVLVVSAGSADHPVAEEVSMALTAFGITPLLFEDRGIAHPTRVFEAIAAGIENEAKVVVVVAGMEGALASYVSALVSLPVIGVPTSVGYGYKAGESALISMLASCAPNLAVVNIDGGLRAAAVAALIVKNITA